MTRLLPPRHLVRLSLLLACGLISLTKAGAEPPRVIVLGTAQDGGYPQAGCQKSCCKCAWDAPELRRFVSCVGIIDPDSGERWLLDCTPDFRDQLRLIDQAEPSHAGKPLTGIFPTHAHVGHYGGLLQLGREVMGAPGIPVYCMPRMEAFLKTNGPWDQLVTLSQIRIHPIRAGGKIQLNQRLSLTVIPVPHRDEYSETVAFQVQGPSHSFLYLPDIDKWDRWDVSINSVVSKVDLAFLDATFFDDNELPGRDMSQIPHPFITETMQRFKSESESERSKIHFIHLNHSNPALDPISEAAKTIEAAGFRLAKQGQAFEL